MFNCHSKGQLIWNVTQKGQKECHSVNLIRYHSERQLARTSFDRCYSIVTQKGQVQKCHSKRATRMQFNRSCSIVNQNGKLE